MTEAAKAFAAELTDEFREKMVDLVDNSYSREYLSSLGSSEEIIRREFPPLMWMEYFFGTLPTNRQVVQVYDIGEPFGRDRDIVVGLNEQIREEIKHGRLYSNLVRPFGVDVDLVTYEPDPSMVEVCRTMVEWDKPHHIAAAFQCSTEIQAALKAQKIAEYIEDDYPHISETLRNHVVSDEGDHIHVGRLLIERFASPDEFDTLRDIAQRKYEASLNKDRTIRRPRGKDA
jgi:hypothetical protein